MIQLIRKELAKFKWPLDYELVHDEIRVGIIFDKCHIYFYKDLQYKTIQVYFVNPNDMNEKFAFRTIIEALGFEHTKDISSYFYNDFKEYISRYISFIYNELLFVVKGDFSWTEKVKIEKENYREICEALGTIDVTNTDVYKKMKSGDPTWRDDLDKLM